MSKFRKMAKKATSVLVSLTTTVWLAGFGTLVPFAAQAATVEELQAQIATLLAQISSLQAQLGTVTGGGSVGSAAKCTFTRSLTMGSKGADVTCLQDYLTGTGHFTYSGGSTGYFGTVTKNAVAAWQAANGVSPAVGYFGPISQAKYSSVVVVTPGPGTTPPGTTPPGTTGTRLSVSPGVQPAASLAPQNAIHIPFTSFQLTAGADGDVKVDSVTIERTGLANDAAFSGVVILDENMMALTNISKSFNSNHQAVLNEPFTVPAGRTKTFYVAGNMAASLTAYAGQVAYLSVVAVNSSAQVTGSLPISGVGHTINATLGLGSVTLTRGPLDPGDVSPTKEVGTTGYVFTSLKATAGSNEDVMWSSIRFNQAGSAAATDLANVKIYDGSGNAYPVTISSDGKYYSTNFNGAGLLMKKGESKEVYIKGDIAGGSNRTVRFDLYRYDDAVFKGVTYGYGIKPSATETGSADNDHDAEFQPSEPRFDADQITIGAGSLRVEKSNDVPAQNIANGDDNATLGAFLFEGKGEPVSFTSWVLTITTTDNASNATRGAITNVTVYDKNGSAIAGPKDFTKTSITFTDTVTVPVGSNVFTVRGNLDNNWENGDTIVLSFTPSTALSSVKGVDTGTTVTPTPASGVTANTQTVKAGGVTISPSTSLASQSVVAGGTGVEVGRFVLDASNSGEDIRVTVAKFHANMDGSGNSDLDDFQTIQLFDGTTALNTGSNVVSPSGNTAGTDATVTVTLDSPGLIIPKGTTKVLTLKSNLTNSFDDSDVAQFDFVGLTDGAWTVTGISTGSELTEDLDTATTGATITIRTGGGWSVEAAPSQPTEKWVAAGSTGVTLNVLRLRATTEDFALSDLRLQIDTTGSSTGADFAKISLWDGATKLVEKTGPAFTNGVEDFTFPTSGTGSFIIPKDSYKELTIKADLANVGTGLSGTAGQLVGVDYDGAGAVTAVNKSKALGKSSGASKHGSTQTDITGNGVVYFRSIPTVERLSIPTTALTSGNSVIYKFQVKADPAYDVALRQFTFQVATTGVTSFGSSVANFTLRNTTDGNKRVSAATGTAAEFYSDLARYSDGSGTLVFNIIADTTDYANAWVTVPAGQTHVFELRADVTTDGTSDSVSTKMLGDNARPVNVDLTNSSLKMTKVSQIDNTTQTKRPNQANSPTTTSFIWSDFSSDATTTHSANTADWMNGFKVPGLLSTGLDASTLSN